MKNEIMKKEDTSLSTVTNLSLGVDESAMMQDYVIPRALLQQGLSERVSAGEAFMGDIIRSTTGDVIGTCALTTKADSRDVVRVSRENPLHVIPLGIKMLWTLMEKIGEKYEYRGTEPRNSETASYPLEFQKDGTDWKRYATIDIFALFVKDIEEDLKQSGNEVDFSKILLPVYISFRSTSLKAGKEFSSYFTNIINFNKQGKNIMPFFYSLPLWCEKVENDKGIFAVFKASQQAKKVSDEVKAKAAMWYHNINSSAVKVDAAEEIKDTDTMETSSKTTEKPQQF